MGTIQMNIPGILAFTVTCYSGVDSKQVTTEEDKINEYSQNIIDLPVVIYNLIKIYNP